MRQRFGIFAVLVLMALSFASCGFGDEGDFSPSICADCGTGTETGTADEPATEAPANSGGTADALWVAPDGSDANPGTVDRPLRTIAKAVAASATAGGVQEVRVAGGDYAEDVMLGGAAGYVGIRLLGGYGPIDGATQERARDVAAHPTSVRGLVVDGSFSAPSNGAEASVDGLSLSRMLVLNASPSVAGCAIVSTASACASGAALTVKATAGKVAAPVFSDSRVENAGCRYGGSNFIHMAVELSANGGARLSPSFVRGEIVGGGATIPDFAFGVSGSATGSSSLAVSLQGSRIESGEAVFSSEGLNLRSDASSVAALAVAQSVIAAGSGATAVCYGVDLGYDPVEGAYAFFGAATIERSTISGGAGCDVSGAIYVSGSAEMATIVNNVVVGGMGSSFASGVSLDGANALLRNNTIYAEAGVQAILVDLVSAIATTQIENNLFAGGGAVTAISEAIDSSPAAVAGNLFDPSVGVVYASNNAANPQGALLTIADLAFAYPGFTPNVEGAALLADPSNGDLHLSAGSTAIDAGVGAFLSFDIDGDVRPQGGAADIGADEFVP